MTIVHKIRDEKLQYDTNREVAKIRALSSGTNDKFEYLTGKEILLSNNRKIIEQSNFAYSVSEKTLEKQTEKQVAALKCPDLSNIKKWIKTN